MPISNPDDKKERFPKEIPRRLFPTSPDLAMRQRLEQSIRVHCDLHVLPVPVEESQSNSHRRNPAVERVPGNMAAESKGSSKADRERQPYSASSSVIVDDAQESTSTRPIERERKPYIAHPGGGKVHEDEPRHRYSQSDTVNSKPRDFLSPHGPSSNHGLSRSYGQDATYVRPAGSGASDIDPTSTSNRARSSSLGVGKQDDYRHSEGDLIHSPNHGYSGQSSSRRYPSPSALSAADLIDDTKRYRDFERDRDDGRGHDSLRDHGRDRDRVRGKYPDHSTSDEDYYRSQGAGASSGSGGGSGSGYLDDYRPPWSGYR